MKTWQIQRFNSIDGLTLGERPDPSPGPRDVVVRVRANSLNSRDIKVVLSEYKNQPSGLVPLSDGAGEVVATGKDARRLKVGERVAAIFHQRWLGGRMTVDCTGSDLGGSIDGMASEYVVLNEEGLVRFPSHLSFDEAATLPCAAVTAWCALTLPVPVMAGDTVLTLGSGGVSVFALQLAKLLGARVISTTSSAEKAARLKALGADEVINYQETPDWNKAVVELTKGRGVDRVVEVGGPGTLTKSIKSVGLGGHITLVGIVAGTGPMLDPQLLRGKGITLRTGSVGSRQDFEAMNRAVELHGLRPVIDRKFAFADMREAYRHLDARKHFGKVVTG